MVVVFGSVCRKNAVSISIQFIIHFITSIFSMPLLVRLALSNFVHSCQSVIKLRNHFPNVLIVNLEFHLHYCESSIRFSAAADRWSRIFVWNNFQWNSCRQTEIVYDVHEACARKPSIDCLECECAHSDQLRCLHEHAILEMPEGADPLNSDIIVNPCRVLAWRDQSVE